MTLGPQDELKSSIIYNGHQLVGVLWIFGRCKTILSSSSLSLLRSDLGPESTLHWTDNQRLHTQHNNNGNIVKTHWPIERRTHQHRVTFSPGQLQRSVLVIHQSRFSTPKNFFGRGVCKLGTKLFAKHLSHCTVSRRKVVLTIVSPPGNSPTRPILFVTVVPFGVENVRGLRLYV